MSKDSTQDSTEQARGWLADLTAPWIQDLKLQVVSARNGEATLTLPFSDQLCREGGSICGQALMSAADTAMILAVGSLFDEFQPTTTVSLNTSFLRPAMSDITVVARVIKPGKRLMFGEIELTGKDGKTVSHATTTYAMI